MDTKNWFAETSGARVTDEKIASILRITRKTANKRLNDGLTADDIITVSRGLGVNPVTALSELKHLTEDEIYDHLESDGKLVETADEGELALELARRLNPITKLAEVRSIEQRRKSNRAVTPESYDLPDEAVAYPHEELGGSLDDLDS